MKHFPTGQYFLWSAALFLELPESTLAQGQAVVESKAARGNTLQTTDYLVPHLSTVPANAGKRTELFVREKVKTRRIGTAPVVLMVHGTTQSAIPCFDLQFENYSWMEHLANAGFDVFAMDLTGYGLSPRPMMDNPCNTASADQQSLLVPKPLNQTCLPSYPYRLTTSQSDWDEINTVVDYLRQRRGVEKVSLIGWSLGGSRVGGYAARYPEKVDRLFLYSPSYDRLESARPPAVLPEAGAPISLRTISSFITGWNNQVKCANQFTPAVRDAIRATILDFDPLGSTWGAEAMWRAPAQNARWGWNPQFAAQVKVPTLVIRGELDTQVTAVHVENLLADLVSVPQKVFIHVACAAHPMVWENQHMVLLGASVEWLKQGTYNGQFNGSFAVDADGRIRQEQ